MGAGKVSAGELRLARTACEQRGRWCASWSVSATWWPSLHDPRGVRGWVRSAAKSGRPREWRHLDDPTDYEQAADPTRRRPVLNWGIPGRRCPRS